jgi:hypothetical protein
MGNWINSSAIRATRSRNNDIAQSNAIRRVQQPDSVKVTGNRRQFNPFVKKPETTKDKGGSK